MFIEGWIVALFVFGAWCHQRETSTRLSAIEAALRPPDPAVEAEKHRTALQWEGQCRAERARLDELGGDREYDAYLAPIRAQIAAQNSR
jgi:hypothetical protein